MEKWRGMVKRKERRVFRLDERMELRFSAIHERLYAARVPVDDWLIRQAYHTGIGEYEYLHADWRTIRVGESWGGPGVSAFFKRRVQIPPEFAGQPVVLRVYFGGDSLLSIHGVPYHGLDPFRSEVLLTECANGDEQYAIDVESYITWHAGEAEINTFQVAELAVIDPEIFAAYWDFRAIFKALQINDIDPKLQAFLNHHLWEALKEIPLDEPHPEPFKTALRRARAIIREAIYHSDRFRGEGLLHLVGHSHLDLVFMWPYREFLRKVGRTHASMLRLMEQYPEFTFCQSQAKLYADLKDHYPDLYAQVKHRVAEGRWEPVGAFWVEPDCNLISGESFVRQILYGQQFWQDEFGVRSRTCWQPDVFGLSWAMPQILQRSGIEYVMTNKMFIWNDTNPWRKNTFWWEGPDGSRVLTVVPPGHFIGMVDPDHMDDHWRAFSEKHTIGESLYCYGWGDGGGGVDPEMLECARRFEDFPGLVKTQLSTAEGALDSIKAKARQAELPVWRDELYLEAHRGTYTNKGRLKQRNRQCEFLYREAELLASLAWMNGAEYPKDPLKQGWLQLLTTQFHDSLPGTHINEVYHALLQEYVQIVAKGERVRQNACQEIIRQIWGSRSGGGGSGKAEAPAANRAVVVVNSLLHSRNDWIALPAEQFDGDALVDEHRKQLVQQSVTELDGTRKIISRLPDIPGVGFRRISLEPRRPDAWTSPVTATSNSLENDIVKVIVNSDGEIVSLWDKQYERESIVPGKAGNRFQLFEDVPGKYDAWDLIEGYREHELDISGGSTLTVDEHGPLRASLLLTKRFRKSSLKQRISLYAGSRVVRFDTIIDWKERQKLLKVAFPVDINTQYATYDMAYGNLTRPTHRNTSYDAARFEVCAHQWMDLSEGDYGISLLNDCKYGHEADGKLMRLSLLKGSVYPDPYGDLEEHSFTYCLYPHPGTWREAGTIHEALNLNNSPYAEIVAEDAPAGRDSIQRFLRCDAPNITLEALKRSEDGRDVILRLVEQHNCRTKTSLVFAGPIHHAWSCNLMEEQEEERQCYQNRLDIALKPYEILTLRIRLK